MVTKDYWLTIKKEEIEEKWKKNSKVFDFSTANLKEVERNVFEMDRRKLKSIPIDLQALAAEYKKEKNTEMEERTKTFFLYTKLFLLLGSCESVSSEVQFNILGEGDRIILRGKGNTGNYYGSDDWFERVEEILEAMGFQEEAEAIRLKKVFVKDDKDVRAIYTSVKKQILEIKKMIEADIENRIAREILNAKDELLEV